MSEQQRRRWEPFRCCTAAVPLPVYALVRLSAFPPEDIVVFCRNLVPPQPAGRAVHISLGASANARYVTSSLGWKQQWVRCGLRMLPKRTREMNLSRWVVCRRATAPRGFLPSAHRAPRKYAGPGNGTTETRTLSSFIIAGI